MRGLLGPAEWYGDPELSDLCGTKDEDENVENLAAYGTVTLNSSFALVDSSHNPDNPPTVHVSTVHPMAHRTAMDIIDFDIAIEIPQNHIRSHTGGASRASSDSTREPGGPATGHVPWHARSPRSTGGAHTRPRSSRSQGRSPIRSTVTYLLVSCSARCLVPDTSNKDRDVRSCGERCPHIRSDTDRERAR